MKYFVTGATGFVGGYVVRRLVADGHEVVVIARDPAKAADLAALGVSVQRGDVVDKESMRAPMRGVDGVYHIAGWYKIGARDTSAAWPTNVDGTRNVLELMRELEIPKGVYTSTLAVNSDTHGKLVDEQYHFTGQHLSIYDRSKAAAHDVAEQMIAGGLPLVIVMPGLIYGPGDTSMVRTTLVQYLQRKLPMVPNGTAYCWAHVDDIATGHMLAMERGRSGEKYIIAGPPHTLVEALAVAEQITGVPAPRMHISQGMVRGMAVLMEPLGRMMPLPEAYTAEGLRVTGATYLGSNAKARRELGYAPRLLAEGLAETLRSEMHHLGMRLPS